MGESHYTIGIDLGGTNIRGAVVLKNQLLRIVSQRINSLANEQEVLQQIFSVTDELMSDSVRGIGIGVPGLVDPAAGIVYDVMNIPSWKEVPLVNMMHDRYKVPVYVDNDANCFTLAEFRHGKGTDSDSMVGLSIGTGLGSGIIIHKELFTGSTGGAGEFGTGDYLGQTFEYYASGQFFQNVYNVDGEIVFERAKSGDPDALKMYDEMGFHLGIVIKMILYALDIDLIVLGGSVKHAYPFFQASMWKQIDTFVFRRARRQLRIEISELEHPGILGAAALCPISK